MTNGMTRGDENQLISTRADDMGTRLISLGGDVSCDADVPNDLLFLAQELCELAGLLVGRARQDYARFSGVGKKVEMAQQGAIGTTVFREVEAKRKSKVG